MSAKICLNCRGLGEANELFKKIESNTHLNNFNLFASLKEKINNGFKNKKVLLITLDSLSLDNQYVFPYLGILYLISIGIQTGIRSEYFDLYCSVFYPYKGTVIGYVARLPEEKTMLLSGRYSDNRGNRIQTHLVEGSIGSLASFKMSDKTFCPEV